MNIATIVFAAAGLALGACVAIMIRAWLKSRAKRSRLATAYFDATQATITHGGRTVRNPSSFASQVWPRLGAGGAGGMTAEQRSRLAVRVPVSPARPVEPAQVLFSEPVLLGSSDPTPVTDTWFSGHGGGFGGAGASGGWDPPADNGGGFTGDTGSSGDGGGSSGGDSGSGGGSSND